MISRRGQGETTAEAERALKSMGWEVAFVCIPNTPHIGAVPITTASGASCQRYPDIVATQGTVIALLEVEVALSVGTATDIVERFRDMRIALANPHTYGMWRRAVEQQSGVSLPEQPAITCTLITCKDGAGDLETALTILASDSISHFRGSDFSPDILRSALPLAD